MRRSTLLLAGLLAAALAASTGRPAKADGFRVPEEKRVENIDPGYCGWCAIETIAKSRAPYYPDDANYQKLLTLVEYRRKCPGTPVTRVHPNGFQEPWVWDPGTTDPAIVAKQLKAFGVSFRANPPVAHGGKKDFAFLKKACDERLGVMIAVKDCPPVAHGSHALAVTDISDAEEEFTLKDGTKVKDIAVYYYDSNNTKGVFRVSKTWLTAAWDGWAVVVEPQGKRRSAELDPKGPFFKYPYVNGPKAPKAQVIAAPATVNPQCPNGRCPNLPPAAPLRFLPAGPSK